jgi:hypothetical protein
LPAYSGYVAASAKPGYSLTVNHSQCADIASSSSDDRLERSELAGMGALKTEFKLGLVLE